MRQIDKASRASEGNGSGGTLLETLACKRVRTPGIAFKSVEPILDFAVTKS
jgi:hypothetical protein